MSAKSSPEADHRGLVADRVDAVQAGLHAVGVAHVAPHPFGIRMQVVGPLGVDPGQQQVQAAHPPPAGQQLVHHVRADEARRPGDQRGCPRLPRHAHRRGPSPYTTIA